MPKLFRRLLLSAWAAASACVQAQSNNVALRNQPMFGGVQPADAKLLLTDEDRGLLAATPADDPEGASAAWIRACSRPRWPAPITAVLNVTVYSFLISV